MILVLHTRYLVNGDEKIKVVKVDNKQEEIKFVAVNEDKISKGFASIDDSNEAIKKMLGCIINPLQLNKRVSEQMKVRTMTPYEKCVYIENNAGNSKAITELLKRSETFGWQ